MYKPIQKITPFLWFDHQAEEAAHFYASIFPSSKIEAVTRYGETGPGPHGSVMTVVFQLEGQQFIALNGGPIFQFNESISFVVNCRTQQEIDHYWSKLTEGGQEVQCGWLKDKYGVSWQIVPTMLTDLIQGPHSEKSQRAFQAMMQMKKLDIAALEAAYNSPPEGDPQP